MIENWLVTGDKHGNFLFMTNGCLDKYEPEKTGIIILGDCSLDFYLNKTDIKKKKDIETKGYYIYWLRGNHESRCSNIKDYVKIFDENVHGLVYYDSRFPHLRAFLDYGFYDIAGYSCLIIGGAYSVDKAWRLQRCMLTEETNDPKKSGWFNDEQLTPEEREDCMRQIKAFAATGKTVDFIMTHTCPYSVEPRDMFLNFIDQSTVDDSMERWLDEVKDTIKWNIWLWGHFHDDRLERPHMEMYYNDIEELQTIVDRWTEYDKTGELPWHIKKSPNFYTKD